MKKNIVIIDDSDCSMEEYDEVFEKADVHVLKLQYPVIEEFVEIFNNFKPDLLITCLSFEGDDTAGYELISKIENIDILKDVPIIVCSKRINDSDISQETISRCRKYKRVVETYSKLPNFPSAEEFLKFAK